MLDYGQKFLPDALTLVGDLEFLNGIERRFLSQVQGRTYVNFLKLFKRWIGAKRLELGHDHALGDQALLGALVRASGEDLANQQRLGSVETATAEWMPPGYLFDHDPNALACTVLARATWAVLAFACRLELAAGEHGHSRIARDRGLAELYRDVLLRHAARARAHAELTEAEWRREDGLLGADERDSAVDDLIALVALLDRALEFQAVLDTAYFARSCGYRFSADELRRIESAVLRAYRLQHGVTAGAEQRFARTLTELLSADQRARLAATQPGA